jgi:hypothetical protein
MALNVWTQNSTLNKINLETLAEGIDVDIKLPVTDDLNVSYSIITGSLPRGLKLQGNRLIGAPVEVTDDTIYNFCIRAKYNNLIADRTFEVTVVGPDAPIILTNAGLLDIGPAKQLFVIDNSVVNYQLNAIDYDLSAGQEISFFINRGDGELPSGLTLTPDGRIVGVVNEVTAITPASGSGSYDNGYYDVGPFDFAIPPKQNGYDTIPFDYAVYDYLAVRKVKSINRKFEFIVSVTDGILTPKRKFEIYVVNEDYFRADADELISNVGLFTADVTYLQAPVWITPSDLGTYRANNYVTIVLDVYSVGIVYYSIDDITKLPTGLSFDVITGEIYGYVPYQPAITTTYSFTVTASTHGDENKTETNSSSRTFTVKLIGEIDSVITWAGSNDLGQIRTDYPSMFSVQATSTIEDAVVIHSVVAGSLPPGLTMSYDGEIMGVVPLLSSNLRFDSDDTYFDVKTTLISFDNGETTFNINGITKFTTVISIPAMDDGLTTFDQSPTTTFDKQFSRKGLTTFDYRLDTDTIYDGGETTIDRQFKFTVEARDQFYYSATERTFSITIKTPTHSNFDNVVVKPFMDLNDRILWDGFITNQSIFEPNLIYRPYDRAFGVQTDLSMLIYAGIQEADVSDYINQMQTNYKNKRFRFGEVKKAVALIPGTHTAVYEVIYIHMIDPIDSLVNHLSRNTIVNNNTYYPSSVTRWQQSLSLISTTDNELLPLWMRSIQPNTRTELGYTLAVPLCYCKVGSADQVLLNIKHSNFKFNLLDYLIDRIIIRSSNKYADKYIIFTNNRNNI